MPILFCTTISLVRDCAAGIGSVLLMNFARSVSSHRLATQKPTVRLRADATDRDNCSLSLGINAFPTKVAAPDPRKTATTMGRGANCPGGAGIPPVVRGR